MASRKTGKATRRLKKSKKLEATKPLFEIHQKTAGDQD
jgi:hypothetical protein